MDFLLQENGDHLLQENGDDILLDVAAFVPAGGAVCNAGMMSLAGGLTE